MFDFFFFPAFFTLPLPPVSAKLYANSVRGIIIKLTKQTPAKANTGIYFSICPREYFHA
jgi:hypothetical protein